MYQQHVSVHILPRLGHYKLASLTTPKIHAFADKLLEDGVSRAMARKVLTSLKALFGDAQLANVAQNVAATVRIKAGNSARAAAQGRRRYPDAGRDQEVDRRRTWPDASTVGDRGIHRPALPLSYEDCTGTDDLRKASSCTCAAVPTVMV